jgi:hypothetical protein
MSPESPIGSIQHLKSARTCIVCNKKVERDLVRKNYAMCHKCLALFRRSKPGVTKRNIKE